MDGLTGSNHVLCVTWRSIDRSIAPHANYLLNIQFGCPPPCRKDTEGLSFNISSLQRKKTSLCVQGYNQSTSHRGKRWIAVQIIFSLHIALASHYCLFVAGSVSFRWSYRRTQHRSIHTVCTVGCGEEFINVLATAYGGSAKCSSSL